MRARCAGANTRSDVSFQRFMLVTGLYLLSLLSACSASRPQTTAHPTSTPPVGPVTVAVTAQQQGDIADHNVKFTVSVTVTNHNTQPIGIAYENNCETYPFFIFILLDSAKHTIWHRPEGGCIMQPAYDFMKIGVGQAHTWYLLLDFSAVASLHPGSYELLVQDVNWHEGTISATAKTTGLHGVASGQLAITIH